MYIYIYMNEKPVCVCVTKITVKQKTQRLYIYSIYAYISNWIREFIHIFIYK